ncbi:hypothetical protein Tco_0169890 [Tanacetum coccineum]
MLWRPRYGSSNLLIRALMASLLGFGREVEDGIYWGRWVGGLHTTEEMAKGGFEAYWLGSERVIPDKGDLSGYWIEISFDSNDGLRGLSVVTHELLLIDMGELVKLNIYMEVGDDWDWVAQGAERQPVVLAAALGGAEDALDIDEGAQNVPAPIHAPPPPPPAGLVERSMTNQGRFSTWMISYMTQLMEASGRTYPAFNGTFRGSYSKVFERRTRRGIDGASTSTA